MSGIMEEMNSTLLYHCSNGAGLSSNSVTPDYWNTRASDSQDTAVTSAAILLTFILVGVPSNLLILVSILRQRLYREPTYIFLLNLAIADLLMCLLYMPFTVVAGFTGGFNFGSTDSVRCSLCQFLGILFLLFSYFTVHTLALISLDRFLFIKFPLKYPKLVTCRRTLLVCTGTWLFSAALSMPPLSGFGDFWYSYSVAACVVTIEHRPSNLHYAILIGLEVCIPVSVLFATNIWILCIVRKQMKKLYSLKKKELESEKTYRDKLKQKLKNSKHLKQLHLLRVFGAIWIANVITWMPFFVRIMATILFGVVVSKGFLVYVYASIVSYTVIHPILEASIIPELRRQLVSLTKKLMCCCQHRDKVADRKSSQIFSETSEPSNTPSSCFSERRTPHCLDLLSATVIPYEE